MNFKIFLKDKKGYDIVYVVINRLGKRAYSIPYYKTTTVKDIVRLFISNIYRTHSSPNIIVLDRGPQFISEF